MQRLEVAVFQMYRKPHGLHTRNDDTLAHQNQVDICNIIMTFLKRVINTHKAQMRKELGNNL